jgi:succinyl-CoA synthetase beta subunit/citryl-CoA synthetase large subunit
VLKALVPVGKRGKAGAVLFADTGDEAHERASRLLAMTVRGFPVNALLVEPKLDIRREMYLSIVVDRERQQPVVIFAAEGGVDIEEISRQNPERIVRHYVDYLKGLEPYEAKEICHRAGLSGALLRDVAPIIHKLYGLFVKYDCEVLEINPLALTGDGKVVLVSSLMAVDSSALFRQSSLQGEVEMSSERVWRPMTKLEKEAVAVNEADPYRGTARYTEMDGDIGFFCGGGGGSLLMFDALRHFGGSPANYSEVGGNPPEAKVRGLARVVLSKPGVKGLIACGNITNNTQVDLIARGITGALLDMGIDPRTFPVLIRYTGLNDEVGRQVFEGAGVEYHGEDVTMSTAARLMVQKMKGMAGR